MRLVVVILRDEMKKAGPFDPAFFGESMSELRDYFAAAA